MTVSDRLSLEHIAEAARFIDAAYLDTPQYELANGRTPFSCRLVVKIECLNPVRSFKARGAHYLASQLPRGSRLVCATAGNFGQGMAVAARQYGHTVVVFTGLDASPLKVERMRALGAEVRQVGGDSDAAHHAAEAFSNESGALWIADGREPALAEGAGTIGVELLRWRERFDAILVPVGDGALMGGIARWVKAHAPETRIIGIVSAGAPAMMHSWRARQAKSVPAGDTIADGLAISTPFDVAVADLVTLVDDMLAVEDSALIEAMRLAHRELGLVLEPSGAAGLAALLGGVERFGNRLVATVLTGGNLTPGQIRSWLMAATDRT
jgi:threonine dehydratase